jgi:hypothetical protein
MNWQVIHIQMYTYIYAGPMNAGASERMQGEEGEEGKDEARMSDDEDVEGKGRKPHMSIRGEAPKEQRVIFFCFYFFCFNCFSPHAYTREKP